MIILKYPTYAAETTAISDDITQNHEAALMNIAVGDTRTWLTTRGTIEMGFKARGDAAPTYWLPADTSYLSAVTYWDQITPWFVTSKGAAHTATNTRINISGITIQLYDTSVSAWRKLNTSGGNPTWAQNKDYSNSGTITNGNATYRTESDSSRSYQFQAGSAAIHGGSTRFTLADSGISAANIGGVFVKIVSKLVLDDLNGVDDREDAQILMNVGADFWPLSTSVIGDFTPMGYLPAAGQSRFGIVGVTPRKHYMTTITPPTVSPTISTFVNGGGVIQMPVATFNANLPPYIA